MKFSQIKIGMKIQNTRQWFRNCFDAKPFIGKVLDNTSQFPCVTVKIDGRKGNSILHHHFLKPYKKLIRRKTNGK